MEPREIALLHARSRIAVGAALVAAPGLAGRMWIGEDASARSVKALTRAVGARDLVLGLGVAIALDRGGPVRGWLEGCAVADTVDLVATVLAGDSIPASSRRGVMAVGGLSALLCGWLSRALDEPPPASAVQGPEAALTGHPPTSAS